MTGVIAESLRFWSRLLLRTRGFWRIRIRWSLFLR